MKLISATFENFRLLRNLQIDFSTDEGKRLTVIRAENESGKTTMLTGLQWALYGDDALPGKGHDFRLHPIDWNISDGDKVHISVQVDFETTSIRQSPQRGTMESKRKYRIIRSTTESLNGNEWNRPPSTVKLFRLEDSGSVPENHPEAIVADELPPELREVFFTDGDRALSFIESTVSATMKRDRVKRAIRSLLGLGVIEDTLKHVKKTASDVNKAAKKVGEGDELTKVTTDLESNEAEIEKLTKQIDDAKQQFTAIDEKLTETEKSIEAALVKGDKEKLKKDIEQVRNQIRKLNNQAEAAAKEHTNIFKGLPLSRDLLAPVLEKALGKLKELEQQGRIPSTTVPVLENRLQGDVCICGESLDANAPDGERRRVHVQHLIDESRKADELQGMITDLFYGSRSLQPDEVEDDERWIADYTRIVERRDELQTLREEEGKKLKALEAQLDAIPDTNIKGLRETKRNYENQRDRYNSNAARYETQLDGLKGQQETLTSKREQLLREQKKGTRVLAELDVVKDVSGVLERSYERITNEELAKVSELMNKLFLEMIGADPEQGAIIQRTEVSHDFDILVYGPNERELNPDRDLNGASRRALTLAFILALTKVSEVEAPNIIDTPLGMMSGYVKQSVLSTAIKESSQLVLFLTRAEIRDCEDIIDREAGTIITLTNPGHYPLMLVNEPTVKERTVLRCDCNHREECSLCRREENLDSEYEIAS